MTQLTREQYKALSEEDQLQVAIEAAAEVVARADAVLGPEGWVEQEQAETPVRGFGERPGDFD